MLVIYWLLLNMPFIQQTFYWGANGFFLCLFSVGNGGQVHHNLQLGASNMPAMHDECLTQPPQLELVSHSIVSASGSRFSDYTVWGLIVTELAMEGFLAFIQLSCRHVHQILIKIHFMEEWWQLMDISLWYGTLVCSIYMIKPRYFLIVWFDHCTPTI